MRIFLIILFAFSCFSGNILAKELNKQPGVRKIKDVVVYDDPQFYVAFPSVVKTLYSSSENSSKCLIASSKLP